jgi:predicted glycosyltransferase
VKILIDITQSSDVYLFRAAIRQWEKHGHKVCLAARDHDIIFDLLEAHGFPYISVGKAGRGPIALGWELIRHESRIWHIMRAFRPDVVLEFGGTFVVHAAFLTRTPSIMLTDTEDAVIANSITFPFATVICTPSCFRLDLGAKHIRFDGFKELAYLRPRHFEPDASVLEDLGLASDEPYALLRLVDWGAAHDIGQRGFDKRILPYFVEQLAKYGRVFVSCEGPAPPDLERFRLRLVPEKIHHVMAFAQLYVGEGATMAAEAAVLGVPAIYVSTRLGLGYLNELESKYNLLHSFADPERALEKALELFADRNAKSKWLTRRERVFAEKVDVTEFIVNLVESMEPTA